MTCRVVSKLLNVHQNSALKTFPLTTKLAPLSQTYGQPGHVRETKDLVEVA